MARRLVILAALAFGLTACNKNSLQGMNPDIAASPGALTYTASAFQGGATSASLTVIVSNEGGGSLNIDAISFENANPEFSWAFGGSSALPVRLAAGEWAAMQVVYSPTDLLQDTNTLLIRSNDPDEDPLAIPITTAALGPQLSCTPNPVAFMQAPGSPTSRTIACSNVGNQPMTVTGFEFAPGTSSEFTSGWTPVPQTLDPGAALPVFNITYTPGQIGIDAGQALIHNSVADYVLQLNGEGTNAPLCDLSAFPFYVSWGTVLLGQTVNKTVLVSNNGSGPCSVTSVSISALTAEFLYTGGQTYTIAPGGSQILTVGYKPTDRFVDIGALNINSNDAAEPTLSVLLNGVGGGPEIDVLPCPVDFGLVTVGCKVDRQVTIYNTGDTSMSISSIMIQGGGGEFSILPTAPTTVGAGGQAVLNLRLAPTSAGNKTKTLVINNNDADEPAFQCVLSGVGTTSDHQVDTFMQPTSPQADILFVVDNSGSMGEEQQSLSNSFATFANYLVSQNASYQVGVTTTDIEVEAGKLVGTTKIITNTTPSGAAKFAANANVGTGGSGTEQGLEAARLAITVPNITGPNLGFLRTTAKLFLVFVSDEEDQSPDGNAGQDPPYFINAYRNVKGVNNTSLLSANAIAGDPTVNGTGGCATAAAGDRYKAVVDSIGGVFASICTTNFGPALQAIGVEATQPLSQFFLTRIPVPATITVTVNGVMQSQGSAWSYDAAGNSIVFSAGSVPALGATIVAEYDVVCQMP